MAQKRITSALRGRVVIFSGFDGKEYVAHVEKVAKGCAKLLYQAWIGHKKEWVTAYVTDASRIR